MGNFGLVLGIVSAAVAALLVAGAVGFVGGTTVEHSSGPVGAIPAPDPPSDGAHGIVLHTSQSKAGLDIFGWQVTQPEHRAHVSVVPPAGCNADIGSEVEPAGACAHIAAAGKVTGDGTGANGTAFVIITVEIDEACYKAIEPGSRWPSDISACA